jgi:putative colanic acid biosynthesis acetyltransferase WcaF
MESHFNQYRYKNRLSIASKSKRLLWRIVWLIAFLPTPSWCLNRWRIALLQLFGAKCGQGCRIASNVRVWAPWNLDIGHYVCLAEGVDCYSVSPIQIGNKVTVSQRAFLCSASHDISSLSRPLIHSPIVIKEHAWVCAEAFIGAGVTVAEGAVVGARAVVVKDVEPWAVVAGNPAKLLKTRVIREPEV